MREQREIITRSSGFDLGSMMPSMLQDRLFPASQPARTHTTSTRSSSGPLLAAAIGAGTLAVLQTLRARQVKNGLKGLTITRMEPHTHRDGDDGGSGGNLH